MNHLAAAPRSAAFALPAKDQALLDSLIKASLAEMRRPRQPEARQEEADAASDSASDPTSGFLASAVAFLAGRPDREALIERLREALTPPAAAESPSTSESPGSDDVRPNA